MTPLQIELNKFRPVIRYENTIGRLGLVRYRLVFLLIFLISLAALYLSIEFNNGTYSPALLGSALIFFALWLEQILLFCYHNNFYFKGFDSIINSAGKSGAGLTYESAQLILLNENDLTGAFMTSPLGREMLIRSGLLVTDIETFKLSNRQFLIDLDLLLQPNRLTTVADIAAYIYMYDTDFKMLLNNEGRNEETFFGAIDFAHKIYIHQKAKERWWSRDNLSQHSGLGRALSTGHNNELEKYSQELKPEAQELHGADITPTHLRVMQKMEETLAKSRSANILLIGDVGVGGLQLLANFEARLLKGSVLNAIENIKFLILDTTNILQNHTTKDSLENQLEIIFSQASFSGSAIIVIKDLSNFILAGASIGVDVTEVLGDYLAQSNLHVIGLDTPEAYHKHLKSRQSFIRRFEEITLEESADEDTLTILEPIAVRQEKRRGVFFTYRAIVAVAELAKRYLEGVAMPERAIDLLHEVAHQAQQTGQVRITEEIIQTFVAEKTGIPIGPVSTEERNRLLNLETILHTRIIGQEAAIKSIASTMRRARVDINQADKPIGSFLFLGPTGVGKTETAKTLANIFFGHEENMVRFDMSEFKGKNTLGHLIGDENGTGILTDKLQEQPYCVLLLDEFEKADSSVHDLFLQILDEGYFTSSHGTRVNARHTIIIATSNAGGELIRKTPQVRAESPILDADIINHIIEAGIFKPELINRFDNTVIYEPLTKIQTCQVAELQIAELITRVKTQGYHLSISRDLVEELTERGFTPTTGGRDIARLIADTIEEEIARKILEGSVEVGGNIHLTTTDISWK